MILRYYIGQIPTIRIEKHTPWKTLPADRKITCSLPAGKIGIFMKRKSTKRSLAISQFFSEISFKIQSEILQFFRITIGILQSNRRKVIFLIRHRISYFDFPHSLSSSKNEIQQGMQTRKKNLQQKNNWIEMLLSRIEEHSSKRK